MYGRFRQTIIFPAILAIVLGALISPPYAAAAEILLTKLYRHSDTTRKSSGVLIAQPRAIDLEIIHLIRSNQMRTLDDYSRWLKKNIRYQKDASRDFWSTPQRTLQIRNGDCEDFTILNMAVMRILGYSPKFLTLKKGKYSHAVCAFKAKGRYFWFDNHTLRRSDARTLNELALQISQQYFYTQVLSWDDTRKGWKSLYKSS